MRYLILSDIHANREALEAVLRQADGCYDDILCCGDLVGYGADPAWVIEWARTTLRTVIRGNHDKACAGLDDLEWFNPAARASALWTQQALNSGQTAYLTALPRGPLPAGGASMVHGSPLDEDEYLIQDRDAAEVWPYLETPVTLFGHTHLQGGFLLRRNAVKRLEAAPANGASLGLDLEPDYHYLINPGSVGQPRDGDPRAAYAIYTPERMLVEYFRAEYDIAAAQAKIRAAGLPEALASRLAQGK